MTTQQNGGLAPTRRTLVKGAAWSVPVVAMAAPAHAACASDPADCECLTAGYGAATCRQSDDVNGQKRYKFEICFYNNCASSVEITLEKFQSKNAGFVKPVGETVTIPAGGQYCFGVYDVTSSNAASQVLVYYLVGGNMPLVYPTVLGAPPQGNCSAIVPNVVGMTQADAEAALTTAGLARGTVTTQCSNTVASGLVISQSPVAGTSVEPGSAVNLVVSTGSCP